MWIPPHQISQRARIYDRGHVQRSHQIFQPPSIWPHRSVRCGFFLRRIIFVAESEVLDVRKFGAVSDDSQTIPSASEAVDAAGENAAAILNPPGVYLTCELHVRASVTDFGISGWN